MVAMSNASCLEVRMMSGDLFKDESVECGDRRISVSMSAALLLWMICYGVEQG
jgi:hypothetical protein